jgi:hypothetical protein
MNYLDNLLVGTYNKLKTSGIILGSVCIGITGIVSAAFIAYGIVQAIGISVTPTIPEFYLNSYDNTAKITSFAYEYVYQNQIPMSIRTNNIKNPIFMEFTDDKFNNVTNNTYTYILYGPYEFINTYKLYVYVIVSDKVVLRRSPRVNRREISIQQSDLNSLNRPISGDNNISPKRRKMSRARSDTNSSEMSIGSASLISFSRSYTDNEMSENEYDCDVGEPSCTIGIGSFAIGEAELMPGLTNITIQLGTIGNNPIVNNTIVNNTIVNNTIVNNPIVNNTIVNNPIVNNPIVNTSNSYKIFNIRYNHNYTILYQVLILVPPKIEETYITVTPLNFSLTTNATGSNIAYKTISKISYEKFNDTRGLNGLIINSSDFTGYNITFRSNVTANTIVKFDIEIPIVCQNLKVYKPDKTGFYYEYTKTFYNNSNTSFTGTEIINSTNCSFSIYIQDNGIGDEDTTMGTITDPMLIYCK